MNLFSQIKAAVTTRQAAEYYGLKVSRNGMTCCPFHQDKHPSMKVDDRYYCFGCHQTGDVISFTAGLFHTGLYEAAQRLAADFHIHISGNDQPERKKEKKPFIPFKPDLAGLTSRLESIRAAAARQEREAWIRQAVDVLAEYRLLLHGWMEEYAPKNEAEDWHPRFVEACTQNEFVDDLFSLIDDPLERDYCYDNYQREVNRIHDRITAYRSGTGNADCTRFTHDDPGFCQ